MTKANLNALPPGKAGTRYTWKKNTMASIKWNPLNIYKFLSSWGLVFKSSNKKDKKSKPHWSLIEYQLLFWKFIIKEKELSM